MPYKQSTPLTAEAVKQFADTFAEEQMAALHVPGAAVVVVQGDSILYQQGYGWAEIASQTAVNPAQTVFRAGSVSKLFTATAVMQLVEQGKIDLHADVNQYLSELALEPMNGRPITVADLLTHTAGFDEVYLGMHSYQAADSLTDFLKRHLPQRYHAPGEVISYNDHGYTLLGLIIEEVSGQPFDVYMEEQVLQPLGMTMSSFTQPAPALLTKHLAVGYGYDGQTHFSYPMDFVHVGPAAALIGPAADMAPFMIAHLNNGRYGETQLLSAATIAEMHQRQFIHHPALRGRAYGFSEWLDNGQRALFHDGGNPGFMSRMFLMPENGVGFFISINGDQYSSASSFSREFTSQFLDAFYPETAAPNPPIATDEAINTAAYSGYYRDIQGYSHDTLQKLAALPNQFSVSGDGQTLSVFGNTWVPVGENTFGRTDGESTLAFRTDETGQATYLFVGTGAYAKVPWYEAQPFHLGLVVWCALMFLTAVFVALFGGRFTGSMRLGFAAVGTLNLIFLVGMGLALTQMDPWVFLFGIPTNVIVLLCLPLVSLVIYLWVGYGWTAAWQSGTFSIWQHGYMALLLATMIAYV
ncbi:MAG: serine hydrolase, partial [Anaerolineales bacterium]|nr:serine hydrolase [Anaerolineales bacterium]